MKEALPLVPPPDDHDDNCTWKNCYCIYWKRMQLLYKGKELGSPIETTHTSIMRLTTVLDTEACPDCAATRAECARKAEELAKPRSEGGPCLKDTVPACR